MYWTGNAKYFSLVNKISNKVWKALESKSVTLEVTTYKPYNLHLVFQTHIVWHRHTAWGFLPPFYSKKKKKKRKPKWQQKISSYYNLILSFSPSAFPIQNKPFYIYTQCQQSPAILSLLWEHTFLAISLFQVHLYEAWRCLMAKMLNYFLDRSFKAMLFRASLNVK